MNRIRPLDSLTLAEIRHAELLAAVVAGFASFGKRRRKIQPKDFWPPWLRDTLGKRGVDPVELERIAREMTIAAGGKVIDGNDQ